MEDIRFHEGRKKGVCLRFAQFSGDPLWVIYCVRDMGSLARLYVAVQHALKSKESYNSAAGDVLTPPEVNILEAVNLATDKALSPVTDTTPTTYKKQTELPEPQKPTIDPRPTETVDGGAWKVEFMSASDTSDHTPSTSSGITSPDAAPSSGPVSPLKVHSRSISPSPKPQISAKKSVSGGSSPDLVVRSTKSGGAGTLEVKRGGKEISAKKSVSGGSSPDLVVRSTKSGGAGTLEVKRGGKESISAPVSLAPSPVTARRKTPGDADDGKTESRNVLSSPEIERKAEKTHLVTARAGNADSNVQGSGRPNPMSLTLSQDSLRDSKKPAKLTTGGRKKIKKPGLERESLVGFFCGKIAREVEKR
jgi:hypothetical protein